MQGPHKGCQSRLLRDALRQCHGFARFSDSAACFSIERRKPLTVTDQNMTLFLLSLDDSINLVLHAYQHTANGDVFIQKASSHTLADLAGALRQLLECPEHPKQIIGTRHGEELYDSLVPREENARAEYSDNHYRTPADNRDLNYSKSCNSCEGKISGLDDYTSRNSKRLEVLQIKELLLKLDYIRHELEQWPARHRQPATNRVPASR